MTNIIDMLADDKNEKNLLTADEEALLVEQLNNPTMEGEVILIDEVYVKGEGALIMDEILEIEVKDTDDEKIERIFNGRMHQ